MSHGHTRIEPKGLCIYCGRTGLKLTDEHVLPLALGGQHVLCQASCLDCADITKRFEQDVARELWGDARISYGGPSRRKKARATHVQLPDPCNPQRRIKVPYSEYPAPLIFYKMRAAGALQGAPPTLDISGAWELVAVSDHEKNMEFERKFGFPLTAKFRHVPISFGRLIAKTAYCNALCTLDPSDFRSICLPYILGSKTNISYIVGGDFDIPPPDAGLGYVLRTIGAGAEDRLIIIGEVRLYANNHTPVYHSIVGEVVGSANVAAISTKFAVGELYSPAAYAGPNNQRPHWAPAVWPLAI
jgi:hypothetical protein